MKAEIKNRLLQISWINRLGTWRRNFILRKNNIERLDLSEIKGKYVLNHPVRGGRWE